MARSDGRFAGKVAIVTGGSSGIGHSASLSFAREGAAVVIADVQDERGRAVAEEIERAGGRALFVHTDVAVDDEVEHMVAATVETFGGLDVAFNNAGFGQPSVFTHECTSEEWARVIGVNLTGVWQCMRHEIPRMLERGAGAIVNTASILGLVGLAKVPAYAASKHGVVGLTKVAALDYATMGVRVNAVCPGVIDTDIVRVYAKDDPAVIEHVSTLQPVGRIGAPEEVSDAVLWLCSDEASLVTGQALAIDGGYVAR